MALRLALNRILTPIRRLSSAAAMATIRPSTDADELSEFLVKEQNHVQSMDRLRLSLSSDLLHQTLLRLRHHPLISLSLFSEFARRGIQPSSQSASILIPRLVSAGLPRHAIRVFQEMGSSGYADFCFLLDTLCKYRHVKVASEVFRDKGGGFVVDVRVYTVLVHGWCKVGRIDMAERVLREMMEAGVEPDVETYNVLLDGVCRREGWRGEDRFEKTAREAERVLGEMRARGIEPDVGSYSIVIRVYGRARRPQLTIDKLNLMKAKGIFPTVGMYTEVVRCLCSCGWLDEAEELLGEMVRSGVSPSPEIYDFFFKAYGERKDVKGAVKLYRKMKEGGLCVPNMNMYNMLLGMFMKMNRMGVVREIWDDMKAGEAGPDLDSFTVLIHGLCEKQKWREACQFFAEMIDRGLIPQKTTVDLLQKGLIQSNMSRSWGKLRTKLYGGSITPGSEFHNHNLKPEWP